MKSIETLLEDTHPRWLQLAGMVRRMAITLTSQVLWQLAGFRMPDGSQEVINAEPFTGAGFYSRPPSSGQPEAIVLNVKNASAPMIIAIRDEKTRAAIVGALLQGETAMYTDKSLFKINADGTMEGRSAGGTAGFLGSLADLQALKSVFQSWTPVAGDGGAALKTLLTTLFTGPPTWPAGTKKLKGE